MYTSLYMSHAKVKENKDIENEKTIYFIKITMPSYDRYIWFVIQRYMGNKNETVLNVPFGHFRLVIMNSIFWAGNEFKKIFGSLSKF